jgi:hypothetical protein
MSKMPARIKKLYTRVAVSFERFGSSQECPSLVRAERPATLEHQHVLVPVRDDPLHHVNGQDNRPSILSSRRPKAA